MNEIKEFLSYSKGTSLSALCEKIITSIEAGESIDVLRSYIDCELKLLVLKRPIAWNRTVSDRCAYEILKDLKKLVATDPDSATIKNVQEKIDSLTRKKIHALFLTQEVSCWASLKSVFNAAANREDYSASLVYTPFHHDNFTSANENYDEYKNMGLPVLNYDEYDLENDSPDVAFMIKPYGNVPEKYLPKAILSVVPRIVYIPYGLELNMDLISFGFQTYLHSKVWRHCLYGEIARPYAEKYGFRDGENVVVWGHPKSDQYREEFEISDELKRFINGRKTILWSPHHLISLDEHGTGTWLIWGKQILQIALNHPEIAFIFRPHPLMMGALINGGHMTQAEADQMEKDIEASGNIFWDRNGSYLESFSAADAIITDGTTFSVEFLYTKKPVILTPRDMSGFYMCDDMMESYYVVNNVFDVERYINMIGKGEDPLKEKRIAFHDKLFFIPENMTTGEYIMENVKADLSSECIKEVDEYIDVHKDHIETAADLNDSLVEAPLFSIAVLTYKNSNYLNGMLDSIFKQDYPRIQLIVSDDGSADFNILQVEEYIGTHKKENIVDVLVLKNEQNMGTVKHIDKVLKHVDGEMLVFTAADDRFYSTGDISAYVEAFKAQPEKEWLVARCQFTSPDYKRVIYVSPTEKDRPYFEQSDPIKLYSRWSRRGLAVPCSMAFRKSAFELVGGIDLRYKYLEDWPLVLKLLRNGYGPIFLERITAKHSTGGVSNSNSYGVEIRRAFYEDKYLIIKDEADSHLDLLEEEDRKALKTYKKEIMQRCYFFYIDLPTHTGKARAKMLFSNPQKLWWFFEDRFRKKRGIFQRKKMLLLSQIFLVLSAILCTFNEGIKYSSVYESFGIMDFYLAIMLFVLCILSFFMEKYCVFKERQRHRLVN